MDHKKRVQQALESFLKKQEPPKGPQRTRIHTHPEKQVQDLCLMWMREKGWDVNIYESKATFDPRSQRYISQSIKAGNADCMGNTADGTPVIVEFKAPGRLSTFAQDKNYRQQEFLRRKIDTNCFAVVVDSPERLAQLWESFTELRSASPGLEVRAFLHKSLPKKTRDQGLF